jgi:DNA-binding MarR family transcriptional regulator
MEASGLVTRRRDQQDERRVWVEATPAGWALRDEIVAVRQKVVQQLPIDAEQIASLRALLQDINAALEPSAAAS